jgi:hypothetical protein
VDSCQPAISGKRARCIMHEIGSSNRQVVTSLDRKGYRSMNDLGRVVVAKDVRGFQQVVVLIYILERKTGLRLTLNAPPYMECPTTLKITLPDMECLTERIRLAQQKRSL